MTIKRRNHKPAEAPIARVPAVVFYSRVSTDEQKKEDTILAQGRFLHGTYAARLEPGNELSPMTLVAEFEDAGVSGAVPVGDRPAGAQMMDMARRGEIDVVIFTKLDRLGRTARVLLDIHDELEALGVAILSATEPFDTRPGPSQSIGKFIFQLLGSIAELERATIAWRFAQGRERKASAGQFLGGPVPFGFAIEGGRLVESDRAVLTPDGPRSEADVARMIFGWVADGLHTSAAAARLNAWGVPCQKRYHSKATGAYTDGALSKGATGERVWSERRLWQMIANVSGCYTGTRAQKVGESRIYQQLGEPMVEASVAAAAKRAMSRRVRAAG